MCRYMITTSHDQYSESPPSHPRLVQVRKDPLDGTAWRFCSIITKKLSKMSTGSRSRLERRWLTCCLSMGLHVARTRSRNRTATDGRWHPRAHRLVGTECQREAEEPQLCDNLTIKYGGCMRTLQLHSGAEFESGAVHRAHQDADAAGLREDDPRDPRPHPTPLSCLGRAGCGVITVYCNYSVITCNYNLCFWITCNP